MYVFGSVLLFLNNERCIEMKKSVFFDFLNRSSVKTFDTLLSTGKEDKDFINWNEFCFLKVMEMQRRSIMRFETSAPSLTSRPFEKFASQVVPLASYWTMS